MKRNVGSLLADHHAVVFERRGILLLLEEEWHTDRSAYWRRLVDATKDDVPALARVTLAQSVVRLARQTSDLEPLVDVLVASKDRQAALRVLRVLFGMAGSDPRIVEYAPWLHACSLLAQTGSDDVLAPCVTLVLSLFDRNRERSAEQLVLLSRCARQLFEIAWEKDGVDAGVLAGLVQAIIETFVAGPDEGAAILERALHVRSHPAWPTCVLWMANMANQLLPKPDLVAQVYSAVIDVFASDEAADDAVQAAWFAEARVAESEGRELPPIPKPQPGVFPRDAVQALAQHVTKFVDVAPALGFRTVVHCLNRWLSRNDAARSKPLTQTELSLSGRRVSFAPRLTYDGASEWSGAFRASIVRRLVAVDSTEFGSLIDELIDAQAPGVVWEALVNTAVHDGRTRSLIEEWFEQPAALRAFADGFARLFASQPLSPDQDTRVRAALQKLGPDSSARIEIENALASPSGLPDDLDGPVLVAGAHDENQHWIRNWLRLSPEEIVAPSNARLIELQQQAQRLEPELSAQAGEAAEATREAAVQLMAEIQVALVDAAHPRIVTYSWCALAALASTYAGASGKHEPGLLQLLLSASEREDSLVESDDDSRDLMNKSRSVPRAQSVEGLINLVQRADDGRVLAAIERLSSDPEPAVRYEVAWYLQFLAKVPPERVWPIVSRLVRDSNLLVAGVAVHRLGVFFRLDAERALELSAAALGRFEKTRASVLDGRADALFQLAWYHLTQGRDVASAAINRAIDGIHTNTAGFQELLHAYRRWLTLGDEEDDEDTATRKRTQEMFARIARAAIAALKSQDEGHVNAQFRTDRPAHAQLLESLAMQLYFASGAFNEKHGDAPIGTAETARFYLENRDLLLELGTSGVISAAERVLETLEYFLLKAELEDPSDARHRFVQVAESAIRSGLGDRVWRLDPIEDVLRRLIAEGASHFDESMLFGWDRIVGALVDKGWRQAFLLARDFDLSL